MDHGVLALQNVVWELKHDHVLVLLAIPVVQVAQALQLKQDLAEKQSLQPGIQHSVHGVRVQQDVVWVLKREHVRASLRMNVVAPVLDPLLKQDRAEWQSLIPNMGHLDHGVLVLRDVAWELKQEHVLALLVILVAHHVLALRQKREPVEELLFKPNIQPMDHGVLVQHHVVWELKQEHALV